MNIDISNLKKQINSELRAEILFYELQNSLKKETTVLTKFDGVSKRSKSKDLLDVSSLLYQDQNGYTNEALVLHLSKNSIYHNLPELLFHPLSVSNSTMSNKEIVAEVKKNKQTEKDTLEFFMPFDNELFLQNVDLANRGLHLFDDKNDLFFKIIDELLAINVKLTDVQKQNLFVILCEGDKNKEDLPELEKILSLLIDTPVKMKYKKHIVDVH